MVGVVQCQTPSCPSFCVHEHDTFSTLKCWTQYLTQVLPVTSSKDTPVPGLPSSLTCAGKVLRESVSLRRAGLPHSPLHPMPVSEPSGASRRHFSEYWMMNKEGVRILTLESAYEWELHPVYPGKVSGREATLEGGPYAGSAYDGVSGGFLDQSWKGTWVLASPPSLEIHLKVPGIGVLPPSHSVSCLITIFLPLGH